MRHRLEDLGRILELSRTLTDHELFDYFMQGRPKDFLDKFRNLSSDKQDDLLHKLPYQIQEVHDALTSIYCIAAGLDELSSNHEGIED